MIEPLSKPREPDEAKAVFYKVGRVVSDVQ